MRVEAGVEAVTEVKNDPELGPLVFEDDITTGKRLKQGCLLILGGLAVLGFGWFLWQTGQYGFPWLLMGIGVFCEIAGCVSVAEAITVGRTTDRVFARGFARYVNGHEVSRILLRDVDWLEFAITRRFGDAGYQGTSLMLSVGGERDRKPIFAMNYLLKEPSHRSKLGGRRLDERVAELHPISLAAMQARDMLVRRELQRLDAGGTFVLDKDTKLSATMLTCDRGEFRLTDLGDFDEPDKQSNVRLTSTEGKLVTACFVLKRNFHVFAELIRVLKQRNSVPGGRVSLDQKR